MKEEIKMTTNYEDLIPKQILFSIKEINDLGIIKSDMCKKLLYKNVIECIKLGNKNFIARTELIRYLKARTISAVNSTENQKLSA
jgi:hypothetical protein